MQHIKLLKDKHLGERCVIVGGGHSALLLDYASLCDAGYRIIVINDNIPNTPKIDYIFYNDVNFIKILKQKKLNDRAVIIGYSQAATHETNYFYRGSDFYNFGCQVNDFTHTGFKAAFLCRRLLGFAEVYLAGFDYTTVGGVSHFLGDINAARPTEQSVRTHINRLPVMLDEWSLWGDDTSGVYNTNPDSALKKFEYKIPIGATNGSH